MVLRALQVYTVMPKRTVTVCGTIEGHQALAARFSIAEHCSWLPFRRGIQFPMVDGRDKMQSIADCRSQDIYIHINSSEFTLDSPNQSISFC